MQKDRTALTRTRHVMYMLTRGGCSLEEDQEGCPTTNYCSHLRHTTIPPPRRRAEEDPAWVIGNGPAELRADSRVD